MIEVKLNIEAKLGYDESGNFVLPWSSWTGLYYKPLKERIEEKEEEWKNIPEGKAVLEEAKSELAVFEKYKEYYSYCFFVMRKPD
jgi:hypothetical protein